MSQYLFENIDPYVDTGVDLATDLNSWKDAIQSSHKGNARPSYAVAGTLWVNDTSAPWKVNVYNGTTDVEIGTMNATTSAFIPTISTPAQFNNSVLPATTAFVQRACGNYSGVTSYSVNKTLTAADVGKHILCTGAGPYTHTLPAASACAIGSSIWLESQGATVTIQRAGTDTITTGPTTGQTSITIGSGDTACLTCFSSGVWGVSLGTPLLKVGGTSGVFGALLDTNGYQILPSGLIIQWGLGLFEAVGGDTKTITLPMANPTTTLAAIASSASFVGVGGSTAYPSVAAVGISRTQIVVQQVTTNASGSYFHWIAIGR